MVSLHGQSFIEFVNSLVLGVQSNRIEVLKVKIQFKQPGIKRHFGVP